MPTVDPGYRFAARVASLKSSAIREILQVVNRPDVISFAGGLPAPELFPTELLGALARDLLQSREAPQALQYGETEGIPALRSRILQRAPFPPGTFGEDGVLVTQGSQQGLDLAAKLFVDPGDEVLVETPAYVGALQALTFLGARPTFLPCDGEGVLPDALAAALRRRPKLLYLTPTFQNPSGVCYSARRRAEVREALAGSDTLLLEDDPYRELWYDTAPPPPVAEGLDPARFLYMGSFSKTAVPGLRVGFMLGAPALVRKCVMAKQAADLHTNSLGQHLLARLLAEPAFDDHVAGLRRAYRPRRDALDAALTARLGGQLSWARPGGGMFLWARLAGGGDAAELLRMALGEGLAFVPGGEFHAEGEGRDTLRLNFSHSNEAKLQEGVERLGRAMEKWRGARGR
ncbi:aminotransferase-like domain-containing protein [Anaeromyxobacter diazotrophicus]|uniref:Aminotransferase n=1 Tax=Anaeromyxobacter diazotrophicus TaxID=2590199 RepID=A0A7I9VMZ6_9BACT|nr:PLP-dependent aminotransferase family protein [Anaeromyxobacter diazotrophicus]GEJ57509.1 aminotransferase [Anaeromyxobacter diazotrophicus]